MVRIEDSEEFRAADQDHLTHAGRLPTREVVPHPRAACAGENHGERGPRPTHAQTLHTPPTCRQAHTHTLVSQALAGGGNSFRERR